jgi:hypothetical protein
VQKGRISTQIQQSKTVFNKETCVRIMMYHLARVLSKPSRFLPHSDRSGWDVVAIRVKLTGQKRRPRCPLQAEGTPGCRTLRICISAYARFHSLRQASARLRIARKVRADLGSVIY